MSESCNCLQEKFIRTYQNTIFVSFACTNINKTPCYIEDKLNIWFFMIFQYHFIHTFYRCFSTNHHRLNSETTPQSASSPSHRGWCSWVTRHGTVSDRFWASQTLWLCDIKLWWTMYMYIDRIIHIIIYNKHIYIYWNITKKPKVSRCTALLTCLYFIWTNKSLATDGLPFTDAYPAVACCCMTFMVSCHQPSTTKSEKTVQTATEGFHYDWTNDWTRQNSPQGGGVALPEVFVDFDVVNIHDGYANLASPRTSASTYMSVMCLSFVPFIYIYIYNYTYMIIHIYIYIYIYIILYHIISYYIRFCNVILYYIILIHYIIYIYYIYIL